MIDIPQPIIAAIIGLLGGSFIIIIDFFHDFTERDYDLDEAKELFCQKYPIRIAISAVSGALLTFIISITSVSAPIWQFVIGMSALGILSKFRNKKS